MYRNRRAGFTPPPVCPPSASPRGEPKADACAFGASTGGGVTLIETLLVTVLVAVVSLSMYALFNNGIKIWQRANQETPEEDVAIFLEKITYDLRNTFNFSKVRFAGTRDEIRLAAIVNSAVGEIIYSFDARRGVCNREQRDYSQSYEDEPGYMRGLLINAKSLNFRYYFYDDEKKEYLWQDEWLEEGLPLAVNVNLELNSGAKDYIFTKTISIPAG